MSRPEARRDLAVRRLQRLGWWGAGRVPDAALRAAIGLGARAAVRHDGRHLQTLRHNLAVATGRPVDDALARAAMRSYLRTYAEVLALPRWSAARVQTTVRVDDEVRLRALVRDRGVVVALPHSANWDLAGAWATSVGLPVTTVAEQLADPDYAAFVAFRTGLGIEVISHRDPQGIARLVAAVRAGRVVCLIADRDLSGAGLPVQWAGRTVTMPAGPALVARRTGAALLPAVCQYRGGGMRIVLGPVAESRPGREGLTAMTQQVADFFSARIAEQPQDWHLLQPFFDPPTERIS